MPLLVFPLAFVPWLHQQQKRTGFRKTAFSLSLQDIRDTQKLLYSSGQFYQTGINSRSS
jgi:hypothetical protein